MNRKLVNALLLVALATGSCSMFTSCKDTDEDFNNEIIGKQVELENKLKTIIDDLGLATQQWVNENFVPEKNLDKWMTDHGYLKDFDAALQEYLKKNNEAGAALVTSANIDGFIKDYLKDNPVNPGTSFDESKLNDYLKLEAYKVQAQELLNLIQANKVTATEAKSKVDALALQVNYFLSAINDRLDNLITDILLNKTWNPMFGSLNIPVGLNSTITAAYYGESTDPIKFPFESKEIVDSEVVAELGQELYGKLTADLEYYTVAANTPYMNEEDGVATLGKLYLSLNPAEIDATSDKIKYELVNSLGEAAPTEEIKLAKYDEALKFGYTRAEETVSNVYVAPVNILAENAPKFALPIADGLKSSMKDVLKNPTNKGGLVALAKVLVNQMKDLGDAYAIKATWETKSTDAVALGTGSSDANVSLTEKDNAPGFSSTGSAATSSFTDPTGKKTNTYIGKYEIAATTVHPLGYAFLQGEGLNKDLLPTIGSIKEAVDKVLDDMKGKIEIKTGITGITGWEDISLNISDIKFNKTEIVINLDGLKAGDADVTFDGNTEIVLGYDPEKGYVRGDNDVALNQLFDAIAKAVNSKLTDPNDKNSLNAQIQDKLVGKVNDLVSQINSQLEGLDAAISGSIDTSINNIKNMLNGKLGRLDSFIDKYDRLADRINDLLKNPNHYLQVALLYEDANGAYHQASDNVNAPTRVKAGSGALDLLATSLTGEIVAPSCKKYVAVGRVWKNGVEVAYDQAAEKLNAGEFINEVRTGRQIQFSLDGSKMEKGCKYEVIYSSLDYNGFTSTRRFYFVVVE